MATRPSRRRANDRPPVPVSPILLGIAPLCLVMEFWHLPGVLLTFLLTQVAAVGSLASRGLPAKDGTDLWKNPWYKGMGMEGSQFEDKRRKRMGWHARMFGKEWATPLPILCFAVGLGFAQIGVDPVESVLGLIGGFGLTWACVDRWKTRSTMVACGMRPVRWAKSRWKGMLVGFLLGFIPALPLMALGLWSLAAMFPLLGLVCSYAPVLRAVRNQYRTDQRVADLLWGAAWQGKGLPDRPIMVSDSKQGSDGSMVALVTVTQPQQWCSDPTPGQTLTAYLASSQQEGAFVLNGGDQRKIEVAIVPVKPTDLSQADGTAVQAACDYETARLSFQYSSRPGACRLKPLGKDSEGHAAAWLMTVRSNGNIDWDRARADWLARSDEGQFAIWGQPRGLHMLIDPAGSPCFVWVGDDRSKIQWDEYSADRMAPTLRPSSGTLTDYLDNIERWQSDSTTLENALQGAKLPAPSSYVYSQEQSWDSGRGWRLTALTLGLQGKAGVTAFDYAAVDLRAPLGNAAVAAIIPLPDPSDTDSAYSAWGVLVRTDPAFCSAPTSLAQLPARLGDRGLAEMLAHVFLYRALATVLKSAPVVGRPIQCSRRGDWSLWRAHVRLRAGVTVADLRRRTDSLAAILGGRTFMWEWVDDTQAFLWAGGEPSRNPREWARRDLYERFDDIRLERAWAIVGVASKSGQTPSLTGREKAAGSLTKLDFSLPLGVTTEDALDRVDAFAQAAQYAWVKPTDAKTGISLLISEHDPLPEAAKADWSLQVKAPGLPFGVLEDGSTAVWDPKHTPHLLASGTTGSGKSSVSVTLAIEALRHGWILAAADPSKGLNDFRPIRPWCSVFADTLQKTLAMCDWAVAEMRRRVGMVKEAGGGDLNDIPEAQRPPYMLVFLDEFNSLMVRNGRRQPNPTNDINIDNQNIQQEYDDRLRARIAIDLSALLTQARSAHILVLLGAQHLSAGALDLMPNASTALNMLGHVFLGKGDATGNVSAPNVKAANRLLRGQGKMPPGRGIYEPLGGKLSMVQCWWAGGGQELVDALKDVPKPAELPDLAPYTPAPPKLVTMSVTKPVAQPQQQVVQDDTADMSDLF